MCVSENSITTSLANHLPANIRLSMSECAPPACCAVSCTKKYVRSRYPPLDKKPSAQPSGGITVEVHGKKSGEVGLRRNEERRRFLAPTYRDGLAAVIVGVKEVVHGERKRGIAIERQATDHATQTCYMRVENQISKTGGVAGVRHQLQSRTLFRRHPTSSKFGHLTTPQSRPCLRST